MVAALDQVGSVGKADEEVVNFIAIDIAGVVDFVDDLSVCECDGQS